ncbi:MAG: GDP-mannose 4,6-dehydratase [Kiritimatiellae bacterium]|jgi:GDP-4-dehydro-6-deoxy-D-mannose reductase|nr:GDP-mannose 4,6-dehydratase [Kiritimatiellia bacterium]
MKILITGAAGFVGRHMINELLTANHQIIAFDQMFPKDFYDSEEIVKVTGNILDQNCINGCVADYTPDACIHLAGIAFVPVGATSPGLVYDINISGTVNILNAFKDIVPGSRVLTVSSANVYEATPYDGTPLKECSPLSAISPYGLSKIASDNATIAWYNKYKLETISVRPGNHTGPMQSPNFVVPNFANQLVKIAKGEQPGLLNVGNLDSKRSFSDVRDIVRAYRLLLEKGTPGQQYNVTSNNPVSIKSILNKLMELISVNPKIQIDTAKFRPTDESPLLDITKIEKDVNWAPEYTLDKTLEDIVKSLLDS